MSTKVMIADDHVLVREGLKQLLEFDDSFEVVCEAGDGVECIEKIKEFAPEVLLLDINMPKKNGIEVLSDIRKMSLPTKIIMLTVHNEVDYLLRAVDIGVHGYLLKDSEISEVKKAIMVVLSGETYIQPKLVPLLNSRLVSRDVDKEKIMLLSDRELEVLKMLALGGINKEIGRSLKISERTVKNHVSNIFKKIGVSDRTQAAVFAIKNDLIKL